MDYPPPNGQSTWSLEDLNGIKGIAIKNVLSFSLTSLIVKLWHQFSLTLWPLDLEWNLYHWFSCLSVFRYGLKLFHGLSWVWLSQLLGPHKPIIHIINIITCLSIIYLPSFCWSFWQALINLQRQCYLLMSGDTSSSCLIFLCISLLYICLPHWTVSFYVSGVTESPSSLMKLKKPFLRITCLCAY